MVAEKVVPVLEEGKMVILDRFYDSTTAYQGYGRENVDLETIHQINSIASLGKEPDITFYMRLSWEESKERTRHLEEDRMEKAGEEFFKRVILGFDYLAENLPRFIKIDANKSIQEIHEKILRNLEAIR